jgi:archaellum component FlaC
MSTQTQTKDPKDEQAQVTAQAIVADMKARPLTATEKEEVEKTFEDAKDFRQLGEKITAPIDSILSETAAIVDSDPIMKVSNTLTEINGEVQQVYKDIIDNDSGLMKLAKAMPLLGGLMKRLDSKWDEAAFNMKDLEGKISMIFSGFDQAYTSLNTSIELQKKFVEGIDQNLGKVIAYKEFLAKKIEEFKEK